MPKLNTIKSRISLILAVITVVFFAVITFFCYTYFKESEKLILDGYSHTIAATAQKLNKGINTVEHNASDLAVVGRTYFDHKLNDDTLKQYLISNLSHYKEPIGVGLWYKPYSIKPKQKLNCINATRDKKDGIVFDPIYQSEKYNYIEQDWFNQIISQVSPEKNVIWTLAHETQDGYPLMITAGSGIYSASGKLVGIATVDWDFDACIDVMVKIKPTPNSFTLFADKKHNYVFFLTDIYMDSKQAVGKTLNDIPWYSNKIKDKVPFTYHNVTYVPFINMLDNGMLLVINVPVNEMFGLMYIKVFLLLSIMGILSGALISLLYLTLNRDVLSPINKLITMANKISNGDIETEIKIEKPVEFALLASTYDKMTDNIKQITSEQTRINYELSTAKSIQLSSLPSIFPPFPEHKEFSIFASMEPAKEVGGDFYDFFFKDKKHLMFLVADVSGKSVPAALFMMTVKTLINNLAQTISSPEELVQTINKKLCANNKEGFFVTVFACIINVDTGKMTCINCGHNPPLLKRSSGKYEYLNLEPNMVLGIFDKIDFKLYETTLNSGDSIFLYTDGITEAMNSKGQVYGEERLEKCLNDMNDVPVEQVIKKVKENVKEYTKGYIQSDDSTMLLFQYYKTLRYFKRPAVKENYSEFKTWLHTTCSEWNLSEELCSKIDMCGEEIFANICFYAYPMEVGKITVSLEKNEKELIMGFEDTGIMYNPLEKPDPDLTIPPKEKPLGGLGIYMVKQMANEIKYKRVRNKNILSLKFEL